MATTVRVTGGALEIEAGPPPIGWPDPGHPIVLPPPPPGIWPPPVSIWPPTPLPPDYPMPPGSIWPPVVSGGPIAPPSPPGLPDQGLPGAPPVVGGGPIPPPARPDQGLPSQKFLVAIVAVTAAGGLEVIGYTVVDPSLHPGHDLPGVPGRPDQGLPPMPQPKG